MSVAAEEVKALVEELEAVLAALNAKIEADQHKKSALQRNLVAYADDLEDLNALLEKQQKLYKQLTLSLDETEGALRQLNNAANVFKTECGKVTRADLTKGL